MNEGTIRGVITLLTFITFIGICWWAYRASNRRRFEEDGLLPFLEDGPVEHVDAPGTRGREGSDE